ncbi:M13-type metalloendopeptidase [Malacoplasma muris]|uniref:M13-type metalloendopeptidase n=1 Tax=Malacoplasma muris TaxID=2119 RepID=UPI00398E64D8
MKNNVRIQDDLYEFVNGKSLSKKEIPKDLPSIGGFTDLVLDVEDKLMKDFDSLMYDNSFIKDDIHLNNAVKVYKKILENNFDSKTAFKLLLPQLKIIDEINNLSNFNHLLITLYNNNIPLPFEFGVDVDMKKTSNYCLFFHGPKTILPDVTYYSNDVQKKKLLDVWSNMVKKILSFHDDLNKEDIEKFINDSILFDEIVSKIVKARIEWAKYVDNYNPIDFNEFSKKIKPINLSIALESIYTKKVDKIIVYDPKFLNNFSKLINENTIEIYKSWAYVNFVLNNCKYLCDDLRIISSEYNIFLMGIDEPSNAQKFAYKLVSFELFPEPIGIYFGKKYLGDKAKNDVISIVKGLIQSYKDRLIDNDWLTEKTKNKAILKLDTMNLKMGYPDKLSKMYSTMKISVENSLYQIANDILNHKKKYMNSLLFEEVDKSIWAMPGHLVNACYNPTSNDITFPAAILQKPYYHIEQSRAANLGGIGVVIGHEISHAFDNNGAQCDENGNLNNWWTESDFSKFELKTKDMIEQFDKLPLGNGFVNGELVVSENIADLGGMASALQTMERENCINYEEFFKNYARVWAQKSRPEYQQLLLAIDVHAPTYWRTNMIPRNFDQWYLTFNVVDNDKMYLPKNKRIKIW